MQFALCTLRLSRVQNGTSEERYMSGKEGNLYFGKYSQASVQRAPL